MSFLDQIYTISLHDYNLYVFLFLLFSTIDQYEASHSKYIGATMFSVKRISHFQESNLKSISFPSQNSFHVSSIKSQFN